MTISDVQLYLAKQWTDAPQRMGASARRADFLPLPAIETMRQQLEYRLSAEFGERRPTDVVLSDAQVQRCAALFAQMDQNRGRTNMTKDAEKLLYASGYMSLVLAAYYSATVFFAPDIRDVVSTSDVHGEGVFIPAILFVSGLFLLDKATSHEFKLREQAWHDCLGKKTPFASEGGWVGQARFEILKTAEIISVLTAPSAPLSGVHRARPRPEFFVRIPLPTGHPSNAIVLTGAAAVLAIGLVIMFAPVGV